jgi:hypothetical protein
LDQAHGLLHKRNSAALISVKVAPRRGAFDAGLSRVRFFR